MGLLTADFTAAVTPAMLHRLGWRTVWLHAALTDAHPDLLVPRDREVLALVASSVLGVDGAAAAAHLRRLGCSAVAARACLTRLIQLGYLSLTGPRVDLPVEDLAWIEGTVTRGEQTKPGKRARGAGAGERS